MKKTMLSLLQVFIDYDLKSFKKIDRYKQVSHKWRGGDGRLLPFFEKWKYVLNL